MHKPDFLDRFDRLVAFDAETTGKRTPDADFIRRQPFAWKPPGIIIEVGFVEMLRDGTGWRKGETWCSLVNPDGPIDPAAINIHKIRPADLKAAPRFPAILPTVRESARRFCTNRSSPAPRIRSPRCVTGWRSTRASGMIGTGRCSTPT
jgi:DNA polymerase III subunit epsilon